jgi:hypothetical protein
MDIDKKHAVEDVSDKQANLQQDEAPMVELTEEQLRLVGGGLSSGTRMACW